MATRIRNNHTTALGLPHAAGTIEANSERTIQDWNRVKGHRIVQNWLESGRLAVVSEDALEQDDSDPGFHQSYDWLDKGVKDIQAALPSIDSEHLRAMFIREQDGKARKGVLEAIEKELNGRDADG